VDGVNSEMVVIQQSEQGTGVVLAKSSCARVLKHIAKGMTSQFHEFKPCKAHHDHIIWQHDVIVGAITHMFSAENLTFICVYFSWSAFQYY